MKKTRLLFRTGICIIIIGSVILSATITAAVSTSYGTAHFKTSPNGAYLQIITFRNRPYEFRISAPRSFEGTFQLFNYEGIRNLIEDIRTPILEEPIQGSTLIDHTINRRGAYAIMIESHVSNEIDGTLNWVEKEAISQDMIWDSTIIIIIGFTATIIAIITKMKRSQNGARAPSPSELDS